MIRLLTRDGYIRPMRPGDPGELVLAAMRDMCECRRPAMTVLSGGRWVTAHGGYCQACGGAVMVGPL